MRNFEMMLRSMANLSIQCLIKARPFNHLRRRKIKSILNTFEKPSVRFMSKESEIITPLSITTKHRETKPNDILEAQNAVTESDPITFHNRSDFLSKYPPKSLSTPRQAWIESLGEDNEKHDLIVLHPDVWGVRPRIDILWSNIDWQKRYKTVKYNDVKDRYDLHAMYPHPRPWPRKGGGKARHRSKHSPIWIQGGKAHGPRGPRTDFYMLQYPTPVSYTHLRAHET